MDKTSMRSYINDLEYRIDQALKRWRKIPLRENGEVVQCVWSFESAYIMLEVFWEDDQEGINIQCNVPRVHKTEFWSGLTKKNANSVMDRLGNFAQAVEGDYHREAEEHGNTSQ